MESIIFLLVAAGIILLGTTVVLLRAREPKDEYRGIKVFQNEMKALAPDANRNPTPSDGIERPAGVDPLLTPTIKTFAPDDDGDTPPTAGQE
jgi:hypothetical protein